MGEMREMREMGGEGDEREGWVGERVGGGDGGGER